jgi:hypothetical protein
VKQYTPEFGPDFSKGVSGNIAKAYQVIAQH